MTKGLAFIGANNPETGRMLHALAKTGAPRALGFIDNDPSKKGAEFCGLPVWGGYEALERLNPDETAFVNLITRYCVTRFETSREVAARGFEFANFLHPTVETWGVRLGRGNYIQKGVDLQAGVRIAENSSIHMGSLIGHETRIGSSVFIAHGVAVSGCVEIEDGVFIGAGVSIAPRVKIGAWATIGTGAVVIKDVAPGAVVVGNPGKEIKYISAPYSSGAPWPPEQG